jgi:hypothetical protein
MRNNQHSRRQRERKGILGAASRPQGASDYQAAKEAEAELNGTESDEL